VSAIGRAAVPLLVAGLAGASGALSCAREAPDPARALVEDVADAAEGRDAAGVLSRVSEAFRGPDGLDRAGAAASLRRYFAAYESIDLEVFDVLSEPADEALRVRTRIGFRGRANRAFGLDGLLPPSAVYRFDLVIRDEGGVWRVRGAEWDVALPPDAPAAP
jgi:hypothetical protein